MTEHKNRQWWETGWFYGILLVLTAFLFRAPLAGLLSLTWHYLVNALLLGCCHWCGRKKRHMLLWGTVFLMALTAASGFYLMYAGHFLESGKTFSMYVGRYAPYSLPIFLFPLAGALLGVNWKKREKQQ